MGLFTNQMRMAGVSGFFDVNEMVIQIMRTHAVRLDRARQNRDVIAWQQQMMQGVGRTLREFTANHFAITGPNLAQSMARPDNFNSTRTSVIRDGAEFNGVSVRTSGTATGTHSLRVVQTAATDRFASNSLNTPIVGLRIFDIDNFVDHGMSLSINHNGRTETFSLSRDEAFLMTNGAFLSRFNTWLGDTFGFDTVQASALPPFLKVDPSNPHGVMLDPAFGPLHAGVGPPFVPDQRLLADPTQPWDPITPAANPLNPAFAGILSIDSDNISPTFGQVIRTNHPLNIPIPGGGEVMNPALGLGNTQRITASFDGGGLLISARDGHHIVVSGSSHTLNAIGIEANATNRASPSQTLMRNFVGTNFAFNINGVNFAYSDGTFRVNNRIFPASGEALTLQDVINAVNSSGAGVRMSFSQASGRITMESTETGNHASISMFETWPPGNRGFLYQLGFATQFGVQINDNQTQVARDAIFYLNNQRLERATNNFNIDDLYISLNMVVNPFAPTPDAPVDLTINVVRDTSGTLEMIRNFVEEYNELIRSIRELTNTRRPRQPGGGGHFMPLTDEQRRAMSEREIELWEEQARTGLLHRNETLRSLTDRLRNAMLQDVVTSSGRRLNLRDLGIGLSSDLERFGELQINEERLEAFVNNNIDDVRDLFTQRSDIMAGALGAPGDPRNAAVHHQRNQRLSESGLGNRINDILNWETMSGGGIAEQAGMLESLEANSVMGRRISDADRRVEAILRDLQRREQRYFLRFSRLEAALMQSHSQMLFLEQMMWGAMQ